MPMQHDTTAARADASATVRVWDRLVRLLHWTLVGCVAVALLSTVERYGGLYGSHQPAGWIALAAVVLRMLWGFGTSRYARYAQFVRGPRATAAYARAVLAHREPRHLGHNPLGAWMVLALMACVIGLALTGWLYTTDRYFGDETVETVHLWLAWTLLALAGMHVGGVIHTSIRQRENLVAAMFSGEKSAPREGDVS